MSLSHSISLVKERHAGSDLIDDALLFSRRQLRSLS